jgi:hypothetical protein
MSEEKTAGLLFALGLNDPEHHKRAKEIVGKVANTRLQVHKIATEKGLHPSKISCDKGLTASKLATDKGLKISKLATDKGMTACKISCDKGMSLKDLAEAHEHGLWIDHVEQIAKKHRTMYGAKNEHIPAVLPVSVKHKAAKLFKNHHEHEIKELFAAIKKDKKSAEKIQNVKAMQTSGTTLAGHVRAAQTKGKFIVKK